MNKAAIGAAVVVGYVAYKRATAGNDFSKPAPTTNSFFNFLKWPDFMSTSTKQLRYFSAAEFGKWWPDMSTDLLIKLDEFRHRLGAPVTISPAAGSLGREMGLTSTSQHNVDMWGEVRAADVMISNSISLERAYTVAKQVGFTGIGLYPDWNPSHGLHLDVRPAALALWSGIMENRFINQLMRH